jgi:hypothetical protein
MAAEYVAVPFTRHSLPSQDSHRHACREVPEAGCHELSAAALWIESASTGSGVASIISLVPCDVLKPARRTSHRDGEVKRSPSQGRPDQGPYQPPYAFEDCGGSLRRYNASIARSLRQFVLCVRSRSTRTVRSPAGSPKSHPQIGWSGEHVLAGSDEP